MVRRIAVALLVLAWFTVSASAQFVVIDPGNLAQAVLIAQRAQQAYEQLRMEYQLIVQMAQGLRDLNRYRIPSIGITALEAARFQYVRPWIEGMNSRDAR